MKKDKNKYLWICIWLAIIAILLLCGVILFAAYIYRFDPLTPFVEIFSFKGDVFWSATNALATIGIGVATIFINKRLSSVQEKQAKIELQQKTLYTEPHVLIDSFKVISTGLQLTVNGKEIKAIKNFDYPYFINRAEEFNYNDFSVLSITFVNTSEAFARLRFDSATIIRGEETIGEFNFSSFGTPKFHIMLRKGESGTIGLLVNNSLLPKINGTFITVRTILDNNFRESFRDQQSYLLSRICEGDVTFIPNDISKNVYELIER